MASFLGLGNNSEAGVEDAEGASSCLSDLVDVLQVCCVSVIWHWGMLINLLLLTCYKCAFCLDPQNSLIAPDTVK